VGTRYDDQPPEHWAGPASLDPTPVWKQYLLVVLLLLGALAIIGVAAALALAPQLATPPALVPGDRLVLARAQAQDEVGGAVRVVIGPGGLHIGEPMLPEQEAVWVFRVGRDEYVAVSGHWRRPDSGELCPVDATLDWRISLTDPSVPAFRAFGACTQLEALFGARGQPLTAPRGLDRYLVSVEGDRLIVNLSRTIRGFGKTPQPTRSPL